MKKLLIKLWLKIKAAFRNLFNHIWNNKLAAAGFFCVVICPIWLLADIMVFAKVSPGVKLTFMGCLAVALIFTAIYKRLKRATFKLKNQVATETILTLFRGIWWGIGLGLIIGVIKLFNKLQAYWWRVGVCFLVGSAFYLLHAVKKQMRLKQKEVEEKEALKEQIKADLRNEI